MKTLFTIMLMMGMTVCSAQLSSATSSLPKSATQSPEMVLAESPQANLLTYNDTANGIPVTAQYSNTMEVSSSSSGEGIGVFFTFKPQGNALDEAEVHVFLPAGTATAAEQMQFVTGPNGLMETNGWTVNNTQSDESVEFPYPWVETVINFSTDKEQSGYILLGQIEGQTLEQTEGQVLEQTEEQAVQVTLLYPSEMADAYWSAAKTVLASLAFDARLLPITASE